MAVIGISFMEKFKTLYTELEEEIFTITLNKPDKLNALTAQTINELRVVIQQVYDDENIKSAIITGAGEKAFSIGVDLNELQELNELNGRKFSENGQEVFSLIENCHKPILAAINGDALGGGCELALACHLRITVENAHFGFPEVRIGIIPGFGGTQRITYLLGKTKALEWLLTGDHFSAMEAKEMSLVSHVVSYKEAVIKKGRELLHRIMVNAPLAIGAITSCANAAYNPNEDGYQTEANSFANCCASEDLTEGIQAFLENRTPQFQGL
jgi:enoyl-CoA hydratase